MISRLVFSLAIAFALLVAAAARANDPEPTVTLKAHKGTLSCLAFDHDGRRSPPARRTGHTEFVRDLALLPDDKWLVTAGRDGKLFVWDFATGKVKAAMDEGTLGFQVVAFAPDGKTFATGGIDRNVTVWDFARVLKDHAVR